MNLGDSQHELQIHSFADNFNMSTGYLWRSKTQAGRKFYNSITKTKNK